MVTHISEQKTKEPKPLTPPDKKQCQAEVPNGNTFMTLGGKPGRERCKNKPAFIVHEKRPGEDGRRGSMSLCESCTTVFKGEFGALHFDFRSVDEKPAKLTKAQTEFLLASTRKRGTCAVSYYRPLVALLRLGLVDDGEGGRNSSYWFATGAGWQWLRDKGLLNE